MSAAFQERLNQLEKRLADLERERHNLRGQLAAERRGSQRSARWRVLGGVSLAGLLIGIGLLASQRSDAEAPGTKAHSVQAPFHVVDQGGKVLFTVDEKSTRVKGVFDVSDKAGNVVMAVDGDGKGITGSGPLRRGVSLSDSSNKVVAFIGVGEGGCGTLETFESGGGKVVSLAAVGVRVFGKGGQKPVARI